MGTNSRFEFLDYFEFLVKRKTLLAKVFAGSLVISYLAIYLLISEQFEATALIIPREEDASSATAGLLRGLKGLPFNLGTKPVYSETDLYTTVIYSRTMLEDLVRKFELLKVYKLDTSENDHMERAVKRLREAINTEETEESAFEITVRASTREMAAGMTNYLIQKMNDRIIDLKISRSRENRIFIEKRVEELSARLRAAEDSLRSFQERSGWLGIFLPLNQLPRTSVEFLRRYREVELNNLLMEYVAPLFEQARIEEKKDYPILQVIDYAVPPAKKSYPPRILFSLLGACSVTLFVYFLLFMREAAKKISDQRLLSVLREAKHWAWKTQKQV